MSVKAISGMFLSIIAVAVVALLLQRRSLPSTEFPQPICSSTFVGGSRPEVRGLMVGESWAGYGFMFPQLPDAIAARNAANVTVCSISVGGGTSRVIAEVLEAHRKEVNAVFGGRAPDFVLVLNGVNDQVQHVGAAQHARMTARIVGYFPTSQVYVVSAPYIRLQRPLPWRVRLHYRFNAYLHDGGTNDVTLPYRAAMKKLAVWHVIDYDEFMPAFRASDYSPDGAHLSRSSFARYGSFLGMHIVLQRQAREWCTHAASD